MAGRGACATTERLPAATAILVELVRCPATVQQLAKACQRHPSLVHKHLQDMVRADLVAVQGTLPRAVGVRKGTSSYVYGLHPRVRSK
jgi:predicted transcriptional regulator